MRIVAIRHCERCKGTGKLPEDYPAGWLGHKSGIMHECSDCDGTGHELIYSDL